MEENELCENCKRVPPWIPGARGGAGRYCTDCIDVKTKLIFDVFEVIKFYGVIGE